MKTIIPTIISIVLNKFDTECPSTQRIKSILFGNNPIICTSASIQFKANGDDYLVLKIPMRCVNLIMADSDED